jgi:hypothetical protein
LSFLVGTVNLSEHISSGAVCQAMNSDVVRVIPMKLDFGNSLLPSFGKQHLSPAIGAFLLALVCVIAPMPVLFGGCSRQPSTGLRGKYYRSVNWKGEPAEVKVDPTIDFDWSTTVPFPGPFSVDWTGNILIQQPGDYQFGLISDDGSLLEIDGRLVVDATSVLLQKQSGQITLSPGLHPIHVRYFNSILGGSVRLFWTPPGSQEQIVPTAVLRPASS